MKKSDKRVYDRQNERSYSNAGQEGQRRTKLKPVDKQKYKPKQIYQDQEEDEDIDIFAYLREEDEDELDY